MSNNIDRQKRLWRKMVEEEAAAMRGVFHKMNKTLNEMFPIKIEEQVKKAAPVLKVKKGGYFDKLFDFWYSPTAWRQYGHNIMNGCRYTECERSGDEPSSKKGFPDLVLVWKGIPWGKLTQDILPECVCQRCTEERIRQRVSDKLRERLEKKLAEFDRMWDKLERNGFVTPP